MKQPEIKIFGGTYKVMQIGFGADGTIKKIIYEVNKAYNQTVFKDDEIANKDLISKRKITEPTHHPFHNYAHAPDLESLLIFAQYPEEG